MCIETNFKTIKKSQRRLLVSPKHMGSCPWSLMLLRLRWSRLTLQCTVASSHYDMRDAHFCCCYFVSIILNWWSDMMKPASDDFWWSWEFHSCAVSKQNIFWILKLTSLMWIKIDLKCFFKYLPNRWCQARTDGRQTYFEVTGIAISMSTIALFNLLFWKFSPFAMLQNVQYAQSFTTKVNTWFKK